MNFPSISYLARQAKDSLLRFPLTLLSAAIAVTIGIYLIENNKDFDNLIPLMNIMLCAALGIPLLFCATIFSDNSNSPKKYNIIFGALATVLLVLLYFTFPTSDSTQNTTVPYVRYAIYNVAIHLLVSFIPFLSKGQLNGFWNYNKILFLRILASVIYSAFLYIGLSMALASLDWLFDVKIDGEIYGQLYVVIMGLFNTWFFVSGIPKRFDDLEDLKEYPKSLKTFSQYVLVPLLALYLLILYGYVAKILIIWDWPKGLVSYLITCVSVLGVLCFLLLYPYGHQSENSWIRKFSKAYYIILFPLVAVLFMAIGIRLEEYGVTVNRYMIVLLGIWLTIICTYFTIGKSNIKFIPISLAIMITLTSFGPWGMFTVSERSQASRLQTILEEGGILNEGKIVNEVTWTAEDNDGYDGWRDDLEKDTLLNDSLHNEVHSILNYLDDHHGMDLIRDWFEQDLDSIVTVSNVEKERWSRLSEAKVYMESMGMSYRHIYKSYASYVDYDALKDDLVTIRNFDYLMQFDKYHYDRKQITINKFTIDSVDYELNYSFQLGNSMWLVAGNDSSELKMDKVVTKLISKYGMESVSRIPAGEMQLHDSTDVFEVKIDFSSIRLEDLNDTVKVRSMAGNVLLRKL